MLFQPGQKPRAIDVHNTANQYLPSGAVLGEGERSFIRSGIGPMRLGDAVGIQDGFPVRLLPYATRVGLLMRTLICNNLNQTYPAPLEARHQFMTLPFRLMGQCDDEGAASLQDAWQRLFNDEVNSTPYNSQAVAEISELVVAEDDRLQAERSMRSSSRGKKEENATSQLLINTVTSAHSGQYNKDRSITMGARKLFRTGVIEDDPKRLGIATRDVCPGDEVWVLAGSSTLKILRSQEGDSRRKKLVGEAYMYGSMHGEVDKLGEELENIVLV